MNFKDLLNPKFWGKSEKEKQILKVKEKYSGHELDKNIATINEEPYVVILKMDVDPLQPRKGMVELDFNDFFVKMLQDNGYQGKNDEDIVNNWFNDLCRTILRQELADQDFGLEESYFNSSDVIKVTDEDVKKARRSNTKDKDKK
jgi:hypothetical protein